MKLLQLLLLPLLVGFASGYLDENVASDLLNEDQFILLEEYLDELLINLKSELCSQKPMTAHEKLRRAKRGILSGLRSLIGCPSSAGSLIQKSTQDLPPGLMSLRNRDYDYGKHLVSCSLVVNL